MMVFFFNLTVLGFFGVVVSFQENDASVRLKIASLLGLLSKTAGFSPDCIMDDAINTLQNESKSPFDVVLEVKVESCCQSIWDSGKALHLRCMIGNCCLEYLFFSFVNHDR